MITTNQHWTEKSVEDFSFSIKFDFVDQLQDVIDKRKLSQKEVKRLIGGDSDWFAQVVTDPGKLCLRTMIRWARAFGLKLTVMLYDDEDKDNKRGPIMSSVFEECWTRQGKPHDWFDLKEENSNHQKGQSHEEKIR